VRTDYRNVLEAVREIPYGEQGSVQQVAQMAAGLDANEDDDLTTVREALAANPIPLLIPDHRVRDGPSGAPPEVEQKLRAPRRTLIMSVGTICRRQTLTAVNRS